MCVMYEQGFRVQLIYLIVMPTCVWKHVGVCIYDKMITPPRVLSILCCLLTHSNSGIVM